MLVPAGLTADAEAMVNRIVAAAKPAHTGFGLRRQDEQFAIGRTLLGLDTVLRRGPSFTPMVTGGSLLAGVTSATPIPSTSPTGS